jgi:hypothetical protein
MRGQSLTGHTEVSDRFLSEASTRDLVLTFRLRRGAIAQLGERLNGIQKVRGSSPLSSTKHPVRTTFSRPLAGGEGSFFGNLTPPGPSRIAGNPQRDLERARGVH